MHRIWFNPQTHPELLADGTEYFVRVIGNSYYPVLAIWQSSFNSFRWGTGTQRFNTWEIYQASEKNF